MFQKYLLNMKTMTNFSEVRDVKGEVDVDDETRPRHITTEFIVRVR